MPSTTDPLVFERVWKRYRTGAQHHSLRDAIPAAVKTLFNRDGQAELQEGEFWALRDVSFAVHRGETLGIIGRNGAGKSTILKLLSGISKQTRGAIRVSGSVAALIEVGAGFHPDLTGRENVYLNGTILGLKRRQIDELFDRIVAFAEVERFIDTPVKRYSSGMYVRLGFAIAAHVHPDILLIDEVLSVGDLAFQQKCLQRIQELKQQGATMVFISHNLNAVQRICDRAILLANGSVEAEGHVETIIRAYREQVMSKERERFTSATSAAPHTDTRRDVQIRTVQLLSAQGTAIDALATGEAATLEVRYVAARRIERPVVKIGIERMDGLLCYEASTRTDDVALPALDGDGVIRLRYPALSLLPNAYRVTIELAEAGSAAPLDVRKHACLFTLTSPRVERGIVRLEHRWEWPAADRSGPHGG